MRHHSSTTQQMARMPLSTESASSCASRERHVKILCAPLALIATQKAWQRCSLVVTPLTHGLIAIKQALTLESKTGGMHVWPRLRTLRRSRTWRCISSRPHGGLAGYITW